MRNKTTLFLVTTLACLPIHVFGGREKSNYNIRFSDATKQAGLYEPLAGIMGTGAPGAILTAMG